LQRARRDGAGRAVPRIGNPCPSRSPVPHHDSDFDHITAAYPQLNATWVVPRGSID